MAINEVLAALADDTRRKILLKLQEGKISSGDLAIALDMTTGIVIPFIEAEKSRLNLRNSIQKLYLL